MRSRYSAFHEGKIDYLMASSHPSRRQVTDRENLTRIVSTTTWIGLRVLAVEGGREGDDTGQVEFVAYYRESSASKQQDGATKQLHERSSFVEEGGRWLYLSGNQESLQPIPELGRNARCWCGSGKKYKKCHGTTSSSYSMLNRDSSTGTCCDSARPRDRTPEIAMKKVRSVKSPVPLS